MEKEQWKNIGHGNKQDYSEAYTFYYKKLYNYGKKFTEDTAMIEDAINEIFIMIWNNRQKLHAVHSPQSYIFTSFRNNIFRKIKPLRLIRFHEPEDDTEIQFSVDSIIIQKETDEEMKNQVRRALQQLTSRQREAIFLRFYEGLSFIEIGRIMGISVKATYKLMARALNEMKEVLSTPLLLLLGLLTDFY